MNVLLISPGFPLEMPLFTRGLAEVGARVLGVGDQPRGALSEETQASLSAYLQVKDLWNAETLVPEVQEWLKGHAVDRVECLWEPGMTVAAELREALEVPGLTVEQTVPFRDKEEMKRRLDAVGLRTPHHARCMTQDECREAAERIGYPLIIKPIDGAGSADTYPLHEAQDLEDALARMKHVAVVSVEEFIEGEEYTYDTVCADGEVLFQNVAWYRPQPLVTRLNPWVSQQCVCLRDLSVPDIQVGVDLGQAVLKALGYQTGFTHMEWFRTKSGEAVFGEIGGRPPGGRLVHVMNYSCDIDLFTGWAEAVCHGRISQDTSKKHNACVVFKRAEGGGDIVRKIEGMDSFLSQHGEHVVGIELVRVGEPKRDWRKIVSGDGWIVVRHPDLESCLEIAGTLCTDVRILTS